MAIALWAVVCCSNAFMLLPCICYGVWIFNFKCFSDILCNCQRIKNEYVIDSWSKPFANKCQMSWMKISTLYLCCWGRCCCSLCVCMYVCLNFVNRTWDVWLGHVLQSSSKSFSHLSQRMLFISWVTVVQSGSLIELFSVVSFDHDHDPMDRFDRDLHCGECVCIMHTIITRTDYVTSECKSEDMFTIFCWMVSSIHAIFAFSLGSYCINQIFPIIHFMVFFPIGCGVVWADFFFVEHVCMILN